LVNSVEASVQKSAGFTSACDLAHRPEHKRAHYPAGRSVREYHVFSPASNPDFPTLAANKQTTILILATSHLFPLSRVVGPSAFSYVAPQCTARVKKHASLAVGIRPTPTLRPAENASIFQAGNRVFAPRFVFARVRRPKTQVPATNRLLREPSEGGFRVVLSPLWPRVVTRHAVHLGGRPLNGRSERSCVVFLELLRQCKTD